MNVYKLSAAIAATLWGLTYIVSATLLPHNPWFIGCVRSILGALPLFLITRELPPLHFVPKLIMLGTLNTGLFFGLLFISALRLPGGIAGTFQAMSPLFSILLVWLLIGQRPTRAKVLSLVIGALGVALVLLKGNVILDPVGVAAALGSALSVACGGVLLQKWGQPMSLTGFTAWQLLVAGLELAAASLALGDVPPSLTTNNAIGLGIVALALTTVPFLLWFKAIKGEGAAGAIPFLLLTPIVAFILDGAIRGIVPTVLQACGIALVISGLMVNVVASRRMMRPVAIQQGGNLARP